MTTPKPKNAMDNTPRIIFFGTPDFARIVLEHLCAHDLPPIAIVTSPDAPAGRGRTLTPSAVKVYAQSRAISVLGPTRLKDEVFLSAIRKLMPDIFVIASYGKFLPQTLLDIPPHGAINVHPSLLPQYRGPSPIQTAILNGDPATGVTLMLTDAETDHGPILAYSTCPIANGTGYTKLHDQLADIGGRLLVETLPKRIHGDITPEKQDHTKATFTKLFTKADGRIDWHKSAKEIDRQVRAFEFWPTTWTTLVHPEVGLPEIKRVKIISARVADEASPAEPGTITQTKNGDLAVCTKDNLLIIQTLQGEGGKEISGTSALNGLLKHDLASFD